MSKKSDNNNRKEKIVFKKNSIRFCLKFKFLHNESELECRRRNKTGEKTRRKNHGLKKVLLYNGNTSAIQHIIFVHKERDEHVIDNRLCIAFKDKIR